MAKKSSVTVIKVTKDSAGMYGAMCDSDHGKIIGVASSREEAIKVAEKQYKLRA